MRLSGGGQRDFLQIMFPFLFLAQFGAKADEVMNALSSFVVKNDGPWAVHLHLMDLHDCRSLSVCPVFLSVWLAPLASAENKGKTKRRASYDMALMLVDKGGGKLISALKDAGRFDDTVLLITGDHGSFSR